MDLTGTIMKNHSLNQVDDVGKLSQSDTLPCKLLQPMRIHGLGALDHDFKPRSEISLFCRCELPVMSEEGLGFGFIGHPATGWAYKKNGSLI